MINIKHLLWIIPLTSIINIITMSILFVGKQAEDLTNIKEGEIE